MLLIAGSVTLIGAAPKATCANESFARTGSTSSLLPCYSDLSVLYHAQQLDTGRTPYLDPCVDSDRRCDEYPVLTMLTMWAAARTGGVVAGYAGFFWANVIVALIAALGCVWALERMGARTVLFAAAPALALYATLNWDLIAVACATIATLLVLQGRSTASGAWLGVGIAAKLYPAILAVPFGLHRGQERSSRDGIRLVASAFIVWLAIDIAFIVAAPTAWSEVFRFNRDRGADFESLWTAACEVHLCLASTVLNMLIPAITAIAVVAVWRRVKRHHPETPDWMLGFPIIVVVVMTGKFWSPQYALWLLPWFALSRVPTTTWASYQASEVIEYFVRSAFMTGPVPAVSLRLLAVVVVIRAILLLRCLIAWMHDPMPATEVSPPRSGAAPTQAVKEPIDTLP
jgi:hypothetical protein